MFLSQDGEVEGVPPLPHPRHHHLPWHRALCQHRPGFFTTCNTTVTVYPIYEVYAVYPIYVVYLQFSTSQSLEQSGDRLFLTSTDAFPQVGDIKQKPFFSRFNFKNLKTCRVQVKLFCSQCNLWIPRLPGRLVRTSFEF